MRRAVDVLVVAGLWCLVGSWIGGLLLFGFVVAPTAFSALPSPDLAGKIIGPVLRSLNLYGMVAGPLLAVLAIRLRRALHLVLLPLALGLAAFIAEFEVTTAIEAIRPLAFGPQPDPAALARFGWLHRVAVTLFGSIGVGTLVLALLHAVADVRERRAP